jgi:hypothetical protein
MLHVWTMGTVPTLTLNWEGVGRCRHAAADGERRPHTGLVAVANSGALMAAQEATGATKPVSGYGRMHCRAVLNRMLPVLPHRPSDPQ